jgi:phosphoribosylanthranilate isomerase
VLLVTFTLLPAVDVADGRVVRLLPGSVGAETTYEDPLEAALVWQSGGAEWIHLVDLDAAFGRDSNAELLASVVEKLDVKVELSGGICDDVSLARALSTGCTRVNLSTAALENPAWCSRVITAHGDRVSVSLDVHVIEDLGSSTQHRLVARGGTSGGADLWETLVLLDRYGCARYVVTDVTRDGRLYGPNVELYRMVTRSTSTPVIASGGISSLGDLTALAQIAAAGGNLEGAIVGSALYAGRFTLPEAMDTIRRAAS